MHRSARLRPADRAFIVHTFSRGDFMKPTIYIAYQGDLNSYQTIEIVNEPDLIETLEIAAKVSSTFRACLRGWWNEHDCVPGGFVVRITQDGWESWSVEYNGEGSEAVSRRIGAGNDPTKAPTGWPLFMFDGLPQ